MSFLPPKFIKVTSDDSIMEYKRTIPKSHLVKEVLYEYEFIKAKTKLGLMFTMTESVLQKNLRNSFKEITNENDKVY